MKRLVITLVVLTCSMAMVRSQVLYKPRDVQAAFDAGTRSADGKPGPKYWQNHGRYEISVTALPPDRNVTGKEKIVYVNNSPDSLRTLVFKLFLNIHKPGAPRNGGIDDDYLTSGVHIDQFTVNGRQQAWRSSPYYFTWQPVRLPALLAPGDSVEMTIDWHYEISLRSNREGMIDSTTYFLAYFYPRVAVYDDYNGWDVMDFTDQQEFYSDFNDYDVKVTVPQNYVVWGTGTLLNADEVLQPAVADRFRQSLTSDEVITVASLADLQAGKVTQAKSRNTWHFRASNIPDMAFGLSDHFVWDAGSVVVDDKTARRASVQAAYNDTAADYHHMVRFGKHALHWLSRNWPGVPYPYEKTTVFQGYAGMEYPMMANDETYEDTVFSRFVAEHEIAHTYFPFYMGINETRYGFMDEGWATTFEYLIGQSDLGPETAKRFFQQFRVTGWITDNSMLEDLPIITPEDVLKNAAYGNNAYGKPALGYLAVKDLLGDDLFRKCLHGYIDRWHGKHPIPWDFFNSFNDISGKDLNWFWNSWYFQPHYIDLAITSVKKSGGGYAISLANKGGMPAPVDVKLTYSDGSTETLHQTPAIWQARLSEAVVSVKTKKTISQVDLDGGIWMDANNKDNHWQDK